MIVQNLEKAAILKDFAKCERWALANPTYFNNAKCKVLCLG